MKHDKRVFEMASQTRILIEFLQVCFVNMNM